ncbi:MAG TPA: hypothetical protein VH593_32960 [Ktedonobacteraceae bacterium]
MPRTDERSRYGEVDNRPDPNNPDIPTHEFIFICKPCVSQGYHLQHGKVRVYPASPADVIGCIYPHVTGDDARFNPFRSTDTWPKSRGKPPIHYALKNYYRNKR